MTLDEAKLHLKEVITNNGTLFSEQSPDLFQQDVDYVAYPATHSTDINRVVHLDGRFSADDLEAIVVYMRQAPYPLFGET
jgi:hypothetical protein